ncbi:hypothetical protein D8674_008497 [Pyrus ussuriensis x Pyrus communis]|uniref:Uncharacterized protein n=1 Tax=Pyrus ussuriensis x Pyrus communis TaxID=2448454 RepID=A0A5N5HTV4_9ROSA|nr:hypothetical protein D8674_008497 [Pyrus ussuriensis x Pyrus communis]
MFATTSSTILFTTQLLDQVVPLDVLGAPSLAPWPEASPALHSFPTAVFLA